MFSVPEQPKYEKRTGPISFLNTEVGIAPAEDNFLYNSERSSFIIAIPVVPQGAVTNPYNITCG